MTVTESLQQRITILEMCVLKLLKNSQMYNPQHERHNKDYNPKDTINLERKDLALDTAYAQLILEQTATYGDQKVVVKALEQIDLVSLKILLYDELLPLNQDTTLELGKKARQEEIKKQLIFIQEREEKAKEKANEHKNQ